MSFAETFVQQLNDPACSMLSGAFIGSLMMWKVIFGLVVLYTILKAVDKLALEPLLKWVKKKIYKSGAEAKDDL